MASPFWSLPNLLTYGRIIAIPALVACFFVKGDWGRWAAMWIFIAAGVSDFLDGYLARAWQQQSAIGRMLDPIADKLIVSAALLMLAADQTIAGWSLWAGVIILCREILVSGLREFLGSLAVGVPVTRLAKWKTVVQMVAIGFLLAGSAGDKIWPYTTLFGLTLLWIAALLTLYTGYDYLPRRGAPRHDRGGAMSTRLLYFAWVKEKTGIAAEEVELPGEVTTVAELIAWLKTRGPEFDHAFARSEVIRAAIDRTHVRHDAAIGAAREIAFFPPVTGG